MVLHQVIHDSKITLFILRFFNLEVHRWRFEWGSSHHQKQKKDKKMKTTADGPFQDDSHMHCNLKDGRGPVLG